MPWAHSLPPRTECKGGPSARMAKPGNPSLLGQEPGPALYPLPLVNPTALPELPRGTGPRPAFSRHPALPGPRLWPSPRHPGPMSLYLSSMMPRASVSWTRPLLAADQLPERAGAYPGPLLSPHPSRLIGALKPRSPAVGVAGSEAVGEVAGQMGKAQDFQNN